SRRSFASERGTNRGLHGGRATDRAPLQGETTMRNAMCFGLVMFGIATTGCQKEEAAASAPAPALAATTKPIEAPDPAPAPAAAVAPAAGSADGVLTIEQLGEQYRAKKIQKGQHVKVRALYMTTDKDKGAVQGVNLKTTKDDMALIMSCGSGKNVAA